MAAEGQDRASASQLTALPRVEDIPRKGDGLDDGAVRDAFDAFRCHVAQLQAQLRVLQAAGSRAGGLGAERSRGAHGRTASHPRGRRVRRRHRARRADGVRGAAFAGGAGDHAQAERCQRARQETDRQPAETLNTARNEARELLATAHADAARELQDAEARGARLLEQTRHQATELTNSARAEVEQTLEWAGMSPEKVSEVAVAIVRSTEQPEERLPPSVTAASEPEPEGSEPSEPQP